MNRAIVFIVVALASLSTAVTGCDNSPGRPRTGSEAPRPSQVVDFETLYRQNCTGCHGSEGRGGAAIALNSPVYLAIADDAILRRVTAQGVPRTAMPAFAQ